MPVDISAVENKASKQLPLKGEIFRKLTHIFAIVIPGGYYVLELSKGQALAIMVPVTLLMIVIDIGRLRGWAIWRFFRRIVSPMIRQTETHGDFTGATYILTATCLTIALFSRPVAVASLAFIIVGDPAAALVGMRFGRHKFKSKSFEGSFAFLVACVLVALVAPSLELTVGLAGAVVATVTEAVSFRVDDNTTVPLVCGLVMTLLLIISNGG